MHKNTFVNLTALRLLNVETHHQYAAHTHAHTHMHICTFAYLHLQIMGVSRRHVSLVYQFACLHICTFAYLHLWL